MSTPFAQQLWPACFSALHLDRFLVGELAAAEAGEVRAHLAGCPKCSAVVKAMQPGEQLPRMKVTALRRGPWRAVAAVAGVAAAASVALMLRPAAPGERTKGAGFALGMYVQHDGEVRRAAPGEQVAVGDAVRFAVTAPSPGYVAVLSLDPAGRASIYFPDGARAASVAAGEDVALPASTRLDQTVGEERIVGLLCASPVELEPLRTSLERGAPLLSEGCKVTRWSFVKR